MCYVSHQWISILSFHELFKVGFKPKVQGGKIRTHILICCFSCASVWTQETLGIRKSQLQTVKVCKEIIHSFFSFFFSNLATAGTDLGRLSQHHSATLSCNHWAIAHKPCINLKVLFSSQTPYCQVPFVNMCIFCICMTIFYYICVCVCLMLLCHKVSMICAEACSHVFWSDGAAAP